MSRIRKGLSEEIAVAEFFAPGPLVGPEPVREEPRERPSHYKVISISLYADDIDRLGDLVRELKERGHTRANKSMLIREALRQVDLDSIPEQR